jgi:predicted PurR-regulated permease PerM
LQLYINQASKIANEVQGWFQLIGIQLDANVIVNLIKENVSAVQLVQSTLTFIMNSVGNLILVLLLILYLLAEQNSHGPGSIRAKIDSQIQRYVVIKTFISALQGLAIYFVMDSILHIQMANLIGLLHFFLNYVPTAGPILATILPLPIIILDPFIGLTTKILGFVIPTLIHLFIGNVMEPMVFGSTLELHPIVVLMSLGIWYSVWGIPGAILAIPITAVLRIVVASVNHPYNTIILHLLEGRISAATVGIDNALSDTLPVSSIASGVSSGNSNNEDLDQGQVLTPSTKNSWDDERSDA